MTWREYIETARDEAIEATKEGYYNNEPSDIAHEVADQLVPVYTSDLLELAANNLFLATNEPELGPAFGGNPTPANIIAANIYEELYHEAYKAASNALQAI